MLKKENNSPALRQEGLREEESRERVEQAGDWELGTEAAETFERAMAQLRKRVVQQDRTLDWSLDWSTPSQKPSADED